MKLQILSRVSLRWQIGMLVLVSRLDRALLRARRAEKDFQLPGNETKVEKNTGALREACATLASIAEITLQEAGSGPREDGAGAISAMQARVLAPLGRVTPMVPVA